jgi:hypothetical protein
MVDINLFEESEEPGKENKEEGWDSSSEGGEEIGDSDLDDELSFEDDISSSNNLDEGTLLHEDDTVPDFEELGEFEQDDDYDVGEKKRNKSSVGLWLFLGLVLILGVLYFYVYLPKQSQMNKKIAQIVRKKPKTVVTQKQPPPTVTKIQPVPIKPESINVNLNRKVVNFIDASKVVFDNLSNKGQFGIIILNNNKFFVQYISGSPGVAQVMGQNIKNLLGSSEFKVSPEDRQKVAGKIYYSGVVSGDLPEKSRSDVLIGSNKFSSNDHFINGVKNFITQHGLIQKDLKISTAVTDKAVRYSKVQIIIEGSKAEALRFFESIKTLNGDWGLTKILIAPLGLNDFSAMKVKLELDFWVGVV